MRQAIALALMLVVGGCGGWSLARAGEPRQIARAFTVRPGVDWSRLADAGAETWTVDGPVLQQIRFAKVEPNQALFRAGPRAKMPAYRAGMSASEVQEFVSDSLARFGASEVAATGLRPAPFGPLAGFRFELAFLAADGLAKRGAAAGAISGDDLLLALYTGASAHYFDKLGAEFDAIVAAITVP